MKTELHQNVRDFLAQPVPHHIGGQPRLTATGKVTNPSDGSPLAEVSLGGGVNSPETFNDYLRLQTIARPLA